jgi:hypothetical protein
MIEIYINNEILPLKNIWYHKRNLIRFPEYYLIKISMQEPKLIEFIKSYVGNFKDNSELVNLLLLKEEESGSLGLIWNLINYIEKDFTISKENSTSSYYILNCLDNISIDNNCLKISGRFEKDK